MDAWVFQSRQDRRLDDLLAERPASQVSLTDSRAVLSTVAAGGVIGRIVIPRLTLWVIVAEGVDTATLRHAVGHIPVTARPEQTGNIGISGHRDTLFRPLRKIQQHDLITLTTLLGEYHYRVVSIEVTGPSDVAVLDPGKTEILTLVACYPFYFVGSAPDGFIVRAERLGNNSSYRSARPAGFPFVADHRFCKGGIRMFTLNVLADFAGSNSRCRPGDTRAPCDQQPIGVQATPDQSRVRLRPFKSRRFAASRRDPRGCSFPVFPE
jgi:sortase A